MMLRRFFLIISLICSIYVSAQQKKITLEDIWLAPKFFPILLDNIIPLNDGKSYAMVENNIFINKYDFVTGKHLETIVRTSELVPEGKDKGISIEDAVFSSDEKKILITTSKKSIYRHSYKADYYVYDISSKKLYPVSLNGKQQIASLSPDGNYVAFMRDNNLFYKKIENKDEIRITDDGKINGVINGAPDWVYEEEFGFNKAYEWSSDGKKIAYIKFDETNVKEYTIIKYGNLYPEEYRYKYPKAGEDNSVVSVHVYNIEDNKTINIDIGPEKDIYIPRIKWTNDPNILCITKLNRLQNKLELLLADVRTGKTTVMFTEENPYYIEIHDNLIFLKDGKSFLWTSEIDGWNHIYLYSLEGKLIRQITKGNWEVTALHGIDEKNGIIYYSSTEESHLDRNVYSISIDGTKKKKLTLSKGTHVPIFSKNYKYFIDKYSTANEPFQYFVCDNDGKIIRTIEKNDKLVENTKLYGFAKKEFFTFKTEENVELTGFMIKPVDFDSTKKYPVLMVQYSGPGSQEVSNSWSIYDFAWHQLLVQNGYIVVCVDGRGTGFRGQEFKKCTYKELGKLETIDQIATAKYLSTLGYIDGSRIGIWGWSFGGYMSLLCMTKGADYFKMGIAVAPVTNWRQYDNIYTERFMQKPQDNGKSYDENSPITHVKKLKGKLLVIHGTADDNVHVQNSFELFDALVNANKQFDMFLYTNKNHGIYGGNTRYHLYKLMTNYIITNL